jgi:hypothetical protein
MRLKEFEIPLSEGFYIAVEIESLAGQIVSFWDQRPEIAP